MVLEELVERAIEAAAGFAGAHGLEAGLLATALVGLYHFHHITAYLRRAIGTLRIAVTVAAALGIGLLVATSMGWVAVESVPGLPAVRTFLGAVP